MKIETLINILLKKSVLAITFFIFLILFFIFVFIPANKKINTDFPNYYVSANMFLDGKDLRTAYDNVEFNKEVLLYGVENQFVSFVPYPPVSALLMIPLAKLEPLNAKLCWNVLNLVFFIAGIYFISKISELNFFLTGILFFISGYAFVNNFFFGQAYLLVLLCLSSSFYFLSNDKNILASVLFSLSVLIKIYTIFFLILFLFRKKFKMVLASAIFIIILNVIVIFITGMDVNSFYYLKIMPRISDGWVGTVYAPEYQSIASLLHTLFYREPSLNPNPVIESAEIYFILKYCFYFGVLIVSVIFVLISDKPNFKLQISLFCFVCMLLLPINASYQYVILIPAIAILIHYYLGKRKYFMAIITLVLLFAMNSPFYVFIVNVFKNTPYFFFGYIKLLLLLYFWFNNILILKENGIKKIAINSIYGYSFVYALLILVFSRMSLAITDEKDDGAVNLLVNPSYMISMPAAFDDKIVFVAEQGGKFNLNSNFDVSCYNENTFYPQFSDSNEVLFETISEKKVHFKKLELSSLTIADVNERLLVDNYSYSKDKTKRCFSKHGQIFLENLPDNKVIQLTSGNSFNTRPVFAAKDSKIIFCSDRKRGVGFTTLYEIRLNK